MVKQTLVLGLAIALVYSVGLDQAAGQCSGRGGEGGGAISMGGGGFGGLGGGRGGGFGGAMGQGFASGANPQVFARTMQQMMVMQRQNQVLQQQLVAMRRQMLAMQQQNQRLLARLEQSGNGSSPVQLANASTVDGNQPNTMKTGKRQAAKLVARTARTQSPAKPLKTR